MAAEYARCRAFIFPGEEDFGLTPLEAMASGRPVVAYGAGGALETRHGGGDRAVLPGTDGRFRWRRRCATSGRCHLGPGGADALTPRRFDTRVFERQMRAFVATAMADHRQRVMAGQIVRPPRALK